MVLLIDRENTREIRSSELDDEERKRFRFVRQDFENIELENNKLYSLS